VRLRRLLCGNGSAFPGGTSLPLVVEATPHSVLSRLTPPASGAGPPVIFRAFHQPGTHWILMNVVSLKLSVSWMARRSLRKELQVMPFGKAKPFPHSRAAQPLVSPNIESRGKAAGFLGSRRQSRSLRLMRFG
jgi:hypothetical protein